MKTFEKDPDAVLDYFWDWNDWLENDEISTHEILLPEGIVLDDSSELNGVVTAWISGGTVNTSYIVTCRVVTSWGRTDDRSAMFVIVSK